MFLKIIHKSKASYLCCYQKESCTESIGTITYSKKLHSLKISAELFLIILGLILMEFFYLLRAAKPSLKKVCKYVFCITTMLTTLIFFSWQVLLFWKQIWGSFWSVLWYFFSISWELFGLLWNFVHIFLIMLGWLSD